MQGLLERVRSTIRKAVPGAEEVISYKIPTYKLQGGPVLYFAGWKQDYSLYPATNHVVAAFADDLAPYEVNAVALHFVHYNFCRPHQTLTRKAKGIHRTPAMAAGLTDRVWTVADIVALLNSN